MSLRPTNKSCFFISDLFRIFFCLSVALSLAQFSKAQEGYTLKINFRDSLNPAIKNFIEDFRGAKNYNDTVQLFRKLESVILDLRGEGFSSAGIDSVDKSDKQYSALLYAGEKYQWKVLRKGNVPDDFLNGTGFRKNHWANKPVRSEQVSIIQKRILRNCENNGYPFATIKLDSIKVEGNLLDASLSLERNKLISIDSIIIKGNATIAPVYIYNYIGIAPGNIYRENQIRKITGRMKELPFIKEVKPSQVLFTEKETKLYLFLDNRKASQFDGILGILPDETKTGKFNLTGEIHLKLQNSLRRGEVIEINWKQLPPNSQDLKAHVLYPFIFNTPFGIDGYLAIFKKDSTYIDVTKSLGVQYAISGSNFLKAFVKDKSSDLQSAKGLENITILPDYADITTLSYGATFHYEKLDYRLNPRHGFSGEITGSAGNRKIRKNSQINPAAYENIRLTSVTYQGDLTFDFYIPLGDRHVLNTGTQSGYIYNPDLFVNELQRIGGLKSLRGFDEESIYASSYVIGKVEYRYLLEQNSFLFLFYNQAWYENDSRNVFVTDTPFGMGTGINFETKIGIMSVSYALGKQFDNPVYFRNAKIHFGIVNYF